MKNKKQEEKVSGEFTNNFSKNEFFDDCLICQAMKAAKNEDRELSFEELQKLFEKVNEEQKLKNKLF